MKDKIRISIADDHPIVMDGLQLMLGNSENVEIISRYVRGNDLLEGLKKTKPDVVILDIKLPDITGDELISQILEKYPQIRVLVLTYLDNLYYVRTMIRRGALGYVSKTCSKDVLLDAINTGMMLQSYPKQICSTLEAKKIDAQKRSVFRNKTLF